MNKTTLSFTLSISALFLGIILMATSANNKSSEEPIGIHNVSVSQKSDIISTEPTPVPGENHTQGISFVTPTPVYIVSVDTPTPTPSCLPSDTNCDGVVDDLYADYDGDGYFDWYDPNPRVCDPCLRPNQWEINICNYYYCFPTLFTIDPCGENEVMYLEFWPYYYYDRGDGHVFDTYTVCNFPANCSSNVVQWSISGTEGTDYEVNRGLYEDDWTIETLFFKQGTYSITASQSGWTSCNPITRDGCSTQITTSSGGSADGSISVVASISYKDRTISQHIALPETPAQIDNALSTGSVELMKDTDNYSSPDEYDDKICCVQLVRSGNIATITNSALKIIDNTTELAQLLAEGYHINFVEGFTPSTTLGQTPQGSNRFAAVFDAKVIYHEFGHTEGDPDLGNTYATPFPDPWDGNLMRAKMSVSGWETNSTQAVNFQN